MTARGIKTLPHRQGSLKPSTSSALDHAALRKVVRVSVSKEEI
jgi:hypothetical protein